ncbi:hypothetical protein [Sodalis glossinidius]|uniref:hypothetical protein n=1 Tax=Sodalis glossinidius TaxID=63612 RepID=UPI00311CAFF3
MAKTFAAFSTSPKLLLLLGIIPISCGQLSSNGIVLDAHRHGGVQTGGSQTGGSQ